MIFSLPKLWHLVFLRFATRLVMMAVFSLMGVVLNPYQTRAQDVGTAVAKVEGMAHLSRSETKDVFRIQDYLNSIRTLTSRFLQVSSAGDFSEGNLSFAKPGKMRLEYDEPNPVLLVADGSHLAYFDKDLEQVSYFDLQSTQAAILLNNKISFSSGEIIVTAFERGPSVFRITLVKRSDSLEGTMTITLSDNPLRLKKWEITDAQGIITNISLINPRFGAPLKPNLFIFEEPNRDMENH